LYSHLDLPDNEYKRKLYETGRDLLTKAGYSEIGMDHFALPQDEMYQAQIEGRLHRNFMGYTVSHTDLLIGLGASSIGDAKYAYAQNTKKVREYERMAGENHMPIFNGHILTESELQTRKLIQDIIIRGKTSWTDFNPETLGETKLAKLKEMSEEGLIHFDRDGLQVRANGMAFIRNICAIFDSFQKSDAGNERRYSKAI
jgi:oxygen-independent coproporphyrinogen-3 oxidase